MGPKLVTRGREEHWPYDARRTSHSRIYCPTPYPPTGYHLHLGLRRRPTCSDS